MQVVLSLAQGGSEMVARSIALSIRLSGFRASICALDAGGPLLRHLEDASIPVHILGRRSGFDWHLLPRLYRLFRREEVDIVQTHHLAPLIYAAMPARLVGATLVHVEHERFTFIDRRAGRRLRVLARLCHRLVVVGEDVREFFERSLALPASKMTVIRNGVDVDRYLATATLPRRANGLAERGRLIGHVARLDPAKDQGTLLRAFQMVSQVHPDTRLVMVGDGPARAQLSSLAEGLCIANRVDFLGQRNDVAELLPHFELFVLSSVNEGLPMALLEAMASARPVVSTSVGEVPAIVESGVTGLLVPPNDPKGLADGVCSMLDRPSWAASLGRSAREAVVKRFSLGSMVQEYRALYGSLGHA